MMHERERHNLILNGVQEKPVVTVAEFVALTGVSEATIRRDIAALHVQNKLRRVRGGAEAISPPQTSVLAGRPFAVNLTLNAGQKRAIAKRAVSMCEDGESIIINGGTTTFQMAEFLASRRLQIFTNSLLMADALVRRSRNVVTVPGGTIYREHDMILSPFENDVSRNFYARRMFMGAPGINRLGLMETDPLLIQAEQKLLNQADELIVLVDSSKFRKQSSLILCGLDRITTIITDDGVTAEERELVQDAGPELVVVESAGQSSSAA